MMASHVRGLGRPAPGSTRRTSLAAPRTFTPHTAGASTLAGSGPAVMQAKRQRGAFDFARVPVRAPEGEAGVGLPDPLKRGIETLSGVAMDDVSVRYDSPHPARLQAAAYTQGKTIHVGPGQERHLAHEAWHVVQQARRRVLPTFTAGSVGINDDPGLEREADVMGARAVSAGQSDAAAAAPAATSSAVPATAPVQQMPIGAPPAGGVVQCNPFRRFARNLFPTATRALAQRTDLDRHVQDAGDLLRGVRGPQIGPLNQGPRERIDSMVRGFSNPDVFTRAAGYINRGMAMNTGASIPPHIAQSYMARMQAVQGGQMTNSRAFLQGSRLWAEQGNYSGAMGNLLAGGGAAVYDAFRRYRGGR